MLTERHVVVAVLAWVALLVAFALAVTNLLGPRLGLRRDAGPLDPPAFEDPTARLGLGADLRPDWTRELKTRGTR